MKEQLLFRFKLPLLERTSFVRLIISHGYRKTGNKFMVYFNGSRGYLSNIEISCEGFQKANNRIMVENLTTKTGTFMSKMVNIYHSNENGVRISIGKE